MRRSYQIAHGLCYNEHMAGARHTSTRPHYLRFAQALALVVGVGGCSATAVPDDCAVYPALGRAGDGGCYYDDGGRVGPCPPGCPGADGGIVGPLAPPDLPA
jgi:hypothetical protein